MDGKGKGKGKGKGVKNRSVGKMDQWTHEPRFSPEVLAIQQMFTDMHTKMMLTEKKRTYNGTFYPHILATPLVDVLSISIDSRLDNDKRSALCEIYGHIRVIDTRDSGKTFSLFEKDENNPESIKLGETLLLTPTSPAPVIVPSEYVKLDVLLYDRNAHNIVIAEKLLVLDKAGEECEEIHEEEVYGEAEGTFARVCYTIFQYAVTATVDVLYFSKGDNFDLISDEPSDNYCLASEEKRHFIDCEIYDSRDCGEGFVANLCGSVAVRSFVSDGNSSDSKSISLFTKSPEAGVHVKSGDFIQLSKSVVVVPAYASSLLVDVDLSHCDGMKPIATHTFEFKLEDSYTFRKDIEGDHGRVRVRVTWDHAYDRQPYGASENNQNRQKLKEEKKIGYSMERMEVFSVAVHNKDFKPFSFYGTIEVKDGKRFPIFEKDNSCPQISHKSGSLATLKGPFRRSMIALDNFSVRVDLKDATTEDPISNGEALWDTRTIFSWLNRRVCSVIRGDRGFAAVHYTAFGDAVAAIVDVKLKDDVPPEYVYGKIIARYSTYEYSTAYDKKHYQSILFDSSDDVLQEARASGLSFRLLKKVVCVPTDSTLIIEADLTISSEPPSDGKFPQGAKVLHREVEFKLNGESNDRLGGEGCFIDVFVKWSSVGV